MFLLTYFVQPSDKLRNTFTCNTKSRQLVTRVNYWTHSRVEVENETLSDCVTDKHLWRQFFYLLVCNTIGRTKRTFSRIWRARLHKGSASLYLPRLPYSTARLFRVAATWPTWAFITQTACSIRLWLSGTATSKTMGTFMLFSWYVSYNMCNWDIWYINTQSYILVHLTVSCNQLLAILLDCGTITSVTGRASWCKNNSFNGLTPCSSSSLQNSSGLHLQDYGTLLVF